MDKNNRKAIATISFMRRFISVFFNIFFNIYVLKIVNDFGYIIKINLIGITFGFISSIIILKFLNKKNAKYIYNSSFIILIICIGLLLVLKDNIIKYIYLFKFLYSFEEAAYSAPNEVAIMGSNNHKTFSSFQANMNILTYISVILTPIFSGFIIESFSYYILFLILIVEAILIMLYARKISKFYIGEEKTSVLEFWNKAKKYDHMKNIYKCMFFRRLSAQGAIIDILPIFLFLKLSSEFKVGAYNSFLAILSIASLFCLKLINNKKTNKNFYVKFSIIIFISTLFLVFKPSIFTIVIYYICMYTLGVVIDSESCSYLFESIKNPELKKYGREHDIVFNIYMFVGQAISYLTTYLLYKTYNMETVLPIVISILMFFLIFSCIYLQKVQNYFYKKS